MQCVILAGGLGTRMRPMTENIPKSMIAIKGHPFLKYQLDGLSRSGVSNVVLCVGYKAELIRNYAQNGQSWGLKITYVNEGDTLRGTAGAIRLAFDQKVLEEKFLVLYGDSFLPINFAEIWKTFLRRSEPALMTILKNKEKWDNSNACFDGHKVTLYKKGLKDKPDDMLYVDYGLSAFQRSVIEQEIASGVRGDLAQLLEELSVQGRLAGLEVHSRFFEIGSPGGLKDFEAFLDGKVNAEIGD